MNRYYLLLVYKDQYKYQKSIIMEYKVVENFGLSVRFRNEILDDDLGNPNNQKYHTPTGLSTDSRGIYKLPYQLIIYISKFLLGTNNELILKNSSKSLLSLILIFKDCRKYYVGSEGIFNTYHYLWKYSSKYFDVVSLAHQYGLNVTNKLIYSKITYTVINVNHPGYEQHGKFTHKDSNNSCLVTFVSLKEISQKDIYHGFDIGVNKVITVNNGIIIHANISDLQDIRIWERLIVVEDYFSFLYKKDIYMNELTNGIAIVHSLTIDKFKELINEREGRKIF